MAGARYTPFSAFWGILVPGVVIGAIVYLSSQPSYLGRKVHSVFGPVIDPVAGWLGNLLRG